MYENIYYSPEKFGLEIVGDIEWAEPNYSFDFTAVWKKSRGEYYLASDSGCSCPAPFENYTSVEDLEGPFDKAGLRSRLDSLIQENKTDGSMYSYGKSEALLRKDARAILDRLK